MAKRVDIVVGSTYQGKIDAAADAAKRVFGEWYQQPVIVNARGVKAKSLINEQPFNKETVRGALNRVKDVEDKEFRDDQGRLKPVNPEADMELIIGMESGLFFRGVLFHDQTVVMVRDRRTDMTTGDISDGVVFPLKYIIKTALKKGGFVENTVGSTITDALGGDKQDPYPQVTNNTRRRREFLEQGTERALRRLLASEYSL